MARCIQCSALATGDDVDPNGDGWGICPVCRARINRRCDPMPELNPRTGQPYRTGPRADVRIEWMRVAIGRAAERIAEHQSGQPWQVFADAFPYVWRDLLYGDDARRYLAIYA